MSAASSNGNGPGADDKGPSVETSKVRVGAHTGLLPLSEVTRVCTEVLALDGTHSESFGRFLAALLADGDHYAKHGPQISKMGGTMLNTSAAPEVVPLDASVRYEELFDRVKLLSPALIPLYEVHMFLLALLYRLDPANDGFVTVEQFDCACEALYHRFPIEAAICADPSSVRAALGPAGQPVPRPPPPPPPPPSPDSGESAVTTSAVKGKVMEEGLLISAISSQFTVHDTRANALVSPLLTPRQLAAAGGPAVADAEVSAITTPMKQASDSSDLSSPSGRFSSTTTLGGDPHVWQFDLDGYSRMAPLYHKLGQARLRDLSKSLVVSHKAVKKSQQQLSSRATSERRSSSDDSNPPSRSTSSSKDKKGKSGKGSGEASPAAAAEEGASQKGKRRLTMGGVVRRKHAHAKARRGSIPYSVIAAHTGQVSV